VIPLLLLVIAYGRIVNYVNQRFALFTENLSFLTTGEMMKVLIPVSLLLGVGIGLVGSFITVRRNLNI
jgi:cell division transport system permease protein